MKNKNDVTHTWDQNPWEGTACPRWGRGRQHQSPLQSTSHLARTKVRENRWSGSHLCGHPELLATPGPVVRAGTAQRLPTPLQAHETTPATEQRCPPQGMDEVELRELVKVEDSRGKTSDQEVSLPVIRCGCQIVKVTFFIEKVPKCTGDNGVVGVTREPGWHQAGRDHRPQALAPCQAVAWPASPHCLMCL